MAAAEYCLRWNNYEPTFRSFVSDLFDSEELVDVSLVCQEGDLIGAHKVVLSACSTYFQKIFQNLPQTTVNPVVVLRDISHDDLQSVLCFMYKGMIRVSQNRVNDILQIAASLQIKGLAGTNSLAQPSASAKAQSPKEDRKSVNNDSVSDTNGSVHETKALPRPPRLHSISGNRASSNANVSIPKQKTEPPPSRRILENNDESENERSDSGINALEDMHDSFGEEQLMHALKPEDYLEPDYDYDHEQSGSLQDSFQSLNPESPLFDMTSNPGLFMNSDMMQLQQGSSSGVRIVNSRAKKRKLLPNPNQHSAASLPNSNPADDGEKRYRCNECGNVYEKYSHLNRHLQTHAAPRFQCDICNKLFVRNDVLRRHRIEVHNIRNQQPPP